MNVCGSGKKLPGCWNMRRSKTNTEGARAKRSARQAAIGFRTHTESSLTHEADTRQLSHNFFLCLLLRWQLRQLLLFSMAAVVAATIKEPSQFSTLPVNPSRARETSLMPIPWQLRSDASISGRSPPASQIPRLLLATTLIGFSQQCVRPGNPLLLLTMTTQIGIGQIVF